MAQKPSASPTRDPDPDLDIRHDEKDDAALHHHREVLVVVPIEEEAHQGNVHINLGWRSWVSSYLGSYLPNYMGKPSICCWYCRR